MVKKLTLKILQNDLKVEALFNTLNCFKFDVRF